MRKLFFAVMAVVSLSVHAADLGDANMSRANKAASTVVRTRMAQERPTDAAMETCSTVSSA